MNTADDVTAFANPYLACDRCGGWIVGATNLYSPGPWHNLPCGHMNAGATSQCPSWGPVDGCSCLDHLGHVPHGEP